jgi:hypothetical protein
LRFDQPARLHADDQVEQQEPPGQARP